MVVILHPQSYLDFFRMFYGEDSPQYAEAAAKVEAAKQTVANLDDMGIHFINEGEATQEG